jgi:signal transduction histidine kinase
VIACHALASRRRALAEACHELRGPLAAVTLGLELGRRHDGLSAARIRAIELELGRAALALGDLEDARGRRRRDEAGDGVDVAGLIEDSVEAWRAVASLRGAGLRLSWSGPRAIVSGNRLRLAQATGNLISNAIEHAGGDVEVRGRAGAGSVRIEVLDDGPGLGMPVAELIRRSARSGRHGHGLRIARAVAIACGGRLAAAPSRHGARVVLELPLRPAARAAHSQPH